LGHAAAHVLRVGVETRLYRTLERLEGADHRGELHTVVGGEPLRSADLALVLTRAQQRRPAAGSGVAAAGAVGIDLDHACDRGGGLTRPPITAGFSRKRCRTGVSV